MLSLYSALYIPPCLYCSWFWGPGLCRMNFSHPLPSDFLLGLAEWKPYRISGMWQMGKESYFRFPTGITSTAAKNRLNP